MGKAVGPDPAAAALAGDLGRDVSRLSPGDQRPGPDLTGDGGLLAAARLCAGSLLACPGGHHRAPLSDIRSSPPAASCSAPEPPERITMLTHCNLLIASC